MTLISDAKLEYFKNKTKAALKSVAEKDLYCLFDYLPSSRLII